MKVNHKQVQKYSKQIARQIKLCGEKFDQIVIITKGGLIPGYYIAKELGIKKIETINLSSYNGKEQKEIINDTNMYFKIDNDLRYLIIDDLIDSGNTIRYIEKNFFKNKVNYEVATLFRKIGSHRQGKYCLKQDVPKDEWISFEYEE